MSLNSGPSDELRTERREGILLAVTGGAFVLLGIGVIIIGQVWLGLASIAFFGACAAVGVAKARRPGQDPGPGLAIMGALGFAFAGAGLIIGSALDPDFLGFRHTMAKPVGILLVIFFGGGAILLIVRQLRRRTPAEPGPP